MRGIGLVLWAAALLLFTVGAAGDASADRACKDAAKAEYRDCKNDCKIELRLEKDLCRNIDPACGLECRVERAGCIEPFEDALDACTDVCRTDRVDAKADCQLITDPILRDQCIDAAQIAAFICKDNCREDTVVDDPNTPEVDPVHWRAGVRACRQAAHACFRACPPPPLPPSPEP